MARRRAPFSWRTSTGSGKGAGAALTRRGSLPGGVPELDAVDAPVATFLHELEGGLLHLAMVGGEQARELGLVVHHAPLPEGGVLVLAEARVLPHELGEVLAG